MSDIEVGDDVRIGKGKKVYQVVNTYMHPREGRVYKLSAISDHPDAAIREQDAFANYPAERLSVVVRRRA